MEKEELEALLAKFNTLSSTFFLFELTKEGVLLRTYLTEDSSPTNVANFLQRLNKGELIELIMKSLINFGKMTGKDKVINEVIEEWHSILKTSKPAVRPLQALRERQ